MSAGLLGHAAEKAPAAHVTLSMGSGARQYTLSMRDGDGKAVAWEIHLDIWNGVKFKQSPGIHVVADNSSTLIANVSHWIGSQCPYGAISEEMESRQPVRIARYSAVSEAPAEEVISMVGKLHLLEGDFSELVRHAEAEFKSKASTA